MENKKFAGYKAALGAFLVIFVNIGVCTTLGVFIAQLASYSGWSLSACVIIGTINTVVNLLLSLVAIPVAKKIGYRWTMLISILAVALHVNMYCFATPGQNVGTLIGALGLTNLANTGLTIVSYIGMPLVVIPLFFIWPQRTRKFRQAEREKAAAEQKS